MIQIKKIFKMYPTSIWILTLIEFIFISRKTIFNVSREVGDYSATVDSSTSLAMLGIICSLIYIAKYSLFIKHINKMMAALIMVYIVAAFSFLWAGNTFTILFKAIEVLTNIYIIGIILILLFQLCNIKQIVYYIILFCLIATYSEVLAEMVRKGFGFHHTNAYSYSAMIAFLLCIGSIRFGLFKFSELKFSTILSFIAWIGGTSTASYIACLAGLILLYSSNKYGFNIPNAIFVLVLCMLLYIFAGDIVYSFIKAGHSDAEMQSGTGRSLIWEASFMSFQDNPILGSGFVIGERELGPKYGFDFHQLSAHNAFLSVLVNTGLIGFFFFIRLLYKWGMILFQNSRRNILSTILFPIYISIVINSAACPSIGSDWGPISSCVYLIIGFSFTLPKTRVHVRKTK